MTPQGWQEKTLRDICVIGAGNSAPQDKDLFENGIYPFFRTADVGKIHFGKINSSEDLLNEKGIKGLKLFKKGTILIPKSGASTFLNHRVKMEVDGFVVSHLATVKGRENVVNDDFLLYYLLTIKVQDLIQDQNYPSVNLPIISNIKIMLPPLPEQERIVAKLDKAFEAIDKVKANAEQNLTNTKELFESYLTSILVNKKDWEKKKLSEVAIDFGRGRSRHRPRNDKKLYGGKYPFIQTGDIRNCNHFITEYSQTYNEFGLAQSKLWPKGTLCITIAANIAETGVLTFASCFPDSVIGCVFDNSKTNIDYVEYLLQSFKAVLQAEGKGSAQDNINLGTFEGQYFPFPDKSTQDKIVIKLDAMRKNIAELEQIYTQKIKECDELKQSILQKAFRGEL